MKLTRLVLWVALAWLAACDLYNDSGSADPGSVWPWVCPDGAPAPEAGCPPAPGCSDGGDGRADGGC
jgi:hypothetical protein